MECNGIQDKYIGWSTGDFNIINFTSTPDWTGLGWYQNFESSTYQMSIGAGVAPYLSTTNGASIRSRKYVKPSMPLIVGHETVVRFRFELKCSALNPNCEIGITGIPGVMGSSPTRSLTHKVGVTFYTNDSKVKIYLTNTGSYDGNLTTLSSDAISGFTLDKNQVLEIMLSLYKNSSVTLMKVMFFVNGVQKWASDYMQDVAYDAYGGFWDGIFPMIYLAGGTSKYVYTITNVLVKSS